MIKYGAIFTSSEYYKYPHRLSPLSEDSEYPKWQGNISQLYSVVGNTLEWVLSRGDLDFYDIEVIERENFNTDEHELKCRLIFMEKQQSGHTRRKNKSN